MNKKRRAGDGIRTHDNHVGNVVLYQLSYTRLVAEIPRATPPRLWRVLLAPRWERNRRIIGATPPAARAVRASALSERLGPLWLCRQEAQAANAKHPGQAVNLLPGQLGTLDDGVFQQVAVGPLDEVGLVNSEFPTQFPKLGVCRHLINAWRKDRLKFEEIAQSLHGI
jgi:hypothetical protein